jgi:hypothetical protein
MQVPYVSDLFTDNTILHLVAPTSVPSYIFIIKVKRTLVNCKCLRRYTYVIGGVMLKMCEVTCKTAADACYEK